MTFSHRHPLLKAVFCALLFFLVGRTQLQLAGCVCLADKGCLAPWAYRSQVDVPIMDCVCVCNSMHFKWPSSLLKMSTSPPTLLYDRIHRHHPHITIRSHFLRAASASSRVMHFLYLYDKVHFLVEFARHIVAFGPPSSSKHKCVM